MLNKKYAKFLAVVMAAGLAFGAAGCGSDNGGKAAAGSSAAAKAVHLKIGYTPGLCDAPLMVAHEKGYLKEAGIDSELINIDGTTLNDAIGTGKVDVAQTLIARTIKPWQNGLAAKATTGTHFGCARTVVRPDSGIKKVADLKGKKIGVAGLNDTGAVILQRALRRAGIGVTPDNMEVEFVTIERNSLPEALKSGQVDAIAMTDPVGYIAEKDYGFVSVLDTAKTEGWKDEYCCAIVIGDNFIGKNKEAAAKVTEAMQKAALYTKAHPQEVAQMLHDKKYIAGEVADNVTLLESYNYTPSIKGGYDAVKASAEDMAELGFADKQDPKEFADAHYQFFDGLPDTTKL